MQQEQAEMLKTIMALGFAAVDLHLYLDTHPEEQRALADFSNVTQQLQAVTARYEQTWQPLTYSRSAGPQRWNWINDPWPWEQTF